MTTRRNSGLSGVRHCKDHIECLCLPDNAKEPLCAALLLFTGSLFILTLSAVFQPRDPRRQIVDFPHQHEILADDGLAEIEKIGVQGSDGLGQGILLFSTL